MQWTTLIYLAFISVIIFKWIYWFTEYWSPLSIFWDFPCTEQRRCKYWGKRRSTDKTLDQHAWLSRIPLWSVEKCSLSSQSQCLWLTADSHQCVTPCFPSSCLWLSCCHPVWGDTINSLHATVSSVRSGQLTDPNTTTTITTATKRKKMFKISSTKLSRC